MVLLNYFQDVFDSLQENTKLSLPVYKENNLEISFEKDDGLYTVYGGAEPILPFASSDVFKADISHWRRLTVENEGCKAVYEVTFDIQGSNFQFKAGDTIGVIPSNSESEVNSLIAHLDLDSTADSSYTLTVDNTKKVKIPAHIPVKSSLRHVLTHCVDLRSVLKKLFLLHLSRHTKDEIERKIMEYLCSKEGSSAYQSHILNRNLCILDIFTIFKSCKPPIQVLLANLPRLLPRPYSIVNSGINETKIIKICFSVMEIENKKGLTTGWLEELILNNPSDNEKSIANSNEESIERRMSNMKIVTNSDIKVPIYLRKNMSGFSLPESMETPLILIGPGTGVSPFIGFLEERESYRNNNPETVLGDVWLFFGCRDPDLDFIYQRELNYFLDKGILNKLCTSFSRVENSKNKYVQDGLKRNSEAITQLIESNASIYVCGDLKNMATQIKETITNCLVTSGRTVDESNKMLADMQRENKYIVDAWS